jgi:rRNA maturation RNase YbeY
LETVKSNSVQFGTDYDEELHRVMIHGVLHLCGFNDKSPEDEKAMREKENSALIRRGAPVCAPNMPNVPNRLMRP